MTPDTSPPPTQCYIVPGRRLSGTRDEILEQLDELIFALRGLRRLISMQPAAPEVRRPLRMVRGILRALVSFGPVVTTVVTRAGH